MNNTRTLLWGLTVSIGTIFSTSAHSEAQLRIVCTDLRFEPASGIGNTSLTLGTSATNGEVVYANSSYDYISGFVLGQPGFPLSGTIRFNSPPSTDANGNGHDDFYEVSQGVSTSTQSGIYETSDRFDEGTVTARWSRAAGSRFGTCQITLNSDTFGEFPRFDHQFELLEYAGILAYDVHQTLIDGTISLAQSGNSSATLGGVIFFSKSADTPESVISVQSGSLSDESGRSITIGAGANPLQRGTTDYFSLMSLSDGVPATPTADFLTWILDLVDEADLDEDGIPNFSDAESIVVLPLPPTLSIELTETKVIITVSGEVGRSYVLESANDVTPAEWRQGQMLTLTAQTQTVELDRPESSTVFWRAKAE